MNMQDIFNQFNNTLNTYLNAFNTSAVEAERQSAREANSFSAHQAELDRIFQENSAKTAMDFEAKQAEILRNWNALQAQIDRDFQQESVNKQMDFQREMSNTVYQRAVQDLQAAGLSPLLAYSNLQTSSPSGSSASGSSGASSAYASGKQASGSRASAFKANISSAKEADLSAFSKDISNIIFGLASAKTISDTDEGKGVIKAVKKFLVNFAKDYNPSVTQSSSGVKHIGKGF